MRYILKAESYDRTGARGKSYCIIAGSAVSHDRNRFLSHQTIKPTIIPTIRLPLKGYLQKKSTCLKISLQSFAVSLTRDTVAIPAPATAISSWKLTFSCYVKSVAPSTLTL